MLKEVLNNEFRGQEFAIYKLFPATKFKYTLDRVSINHACPAKGGKPRTLNLEPRTKNYSSFIQSKSICFF
jgi:hypothetical protein